MTSLRVIYAGTPEFSVPALRSIVAAGHAVAAVYTQPDRRAGRGRKVAFGPVKNAALELGLKVEQPEQLKDDAVQQQLASYNADVMVVAAYGLLLPQAVLDLPRYGCINIHASLLPRWRGAAPIQRAIAAGDSRSGVTIMQMDAGLDTGAMLLRAECEIDRDTTGAELHDTLAALGAPSILTVLEQTAAGSLQMIAQDDGQACYARKIEKSEALLDWNKPAIELHRQVCAFNAWPVAQTTLAGETLRVWTSQPLDMTPNLSAGQVESTDGGVDVATGAGVLRLLSVQAPGKKPVSASDFVNGRALAVGTRVGGPAIG